MDLLNDNSLKKLSKTELKEFFKDLNGVNEDFIKFIDNFDKTKDTYMQYQKWMNDTSSPSTNSTPPPNPTPPSKKTNKFGNISKNFKNALSQMGIEAAISFAAETIISSLSDAFQKRKHLEESGKNITSNFNTLQDSYSQDSSTLSALQSEYDTLSAGVDSFGRNISLTNDEYDRYKDIMSQVSDLIPEMSMRYDSQGNAVSALTGKIKDLNKEYQKTQREKVRDLFNQKDENGNNIYDVMKHAETESETNPFFKEGNRIVNDYMDMFDSFKEGDFMGGIKKGISNILLNNGVSGHVSAIYHLQNMISDSITEPLDVQINELTKDIESGKYQGTELGEKQGKLFELQQKQKEQHDVWRTYASGYAQLYDPDNDGNSNFFDLDEEKQGFLTSFFANMSPDFIEENELTSQAAISQFVSQWIDGLGDENSEISQAFQRLQNFNPDTKDMTPEEINETIDNLIHDLLNAMESSGMKVNGFSAASFKESSGLQTVADNAKKYKENLNYFNTKEELAPKDFSIVWDSLGSDSKDTLLNTANSCELTGDKIKELAKDNKELDAALEASGMSADDFARSIREVSIDNLGNDMDDYENALQKIRDGKSLSAEETATIISKNESLANSVTKTKDGYKIEEDALLSVINASKDKYNVVVTNEILETENVLKNTKKRILHMKMN